MIANITSLSPALYDYQRHSIAMVTSDYQEATNHNITTSNSKQKTPTQTLAIIRTKVSYILTSFIKNQEGEEKITLIIDADRCQ